VDQALSRHIDPIVRKALRMAALEQRLTRHINDALELPPTEMRLVAVGMK